jgi:predicted permease
MTMLRSLIRVLRSLLGRRRFEREMSEELRFHLESQAARLRSQGMSPEAAMGRARAQFGSVEGTKEEARESTGLRLWDELRSDVRYAVRGLRRSPGYASVAVVTLALGIGANTTIFSVIDGVLLRPLPFPEAERLVQVAVYPNGAFPFYQQSPLYAAVGAYSYQGELNLLSDGAPERVSGRLVSAGLFGVLGVEAQEGRTFRAGEDQTGAAPVAIISDGLWRRRFGADVGIVGRAVDVDGVSHEIVGVLPRGFNFPTDGTEIWIPITYRFDQPIPLWNSSSTIIGRLKPSLPVATADAEHRGMIDRVREGFPWPMPKEFGRGEENHVRPLAAVMTAGVQGRLFLLLGAVGLVLLIACANVANLNLTRMAGREREVVVRQALGGTRGRIARQLMVEQLFLAGTGAAAGVGLAMVGTPLLVRWLPPGTPRLDTVTIDGRVLAFTAAASVLAAVLAALGPILRVPHGGSGTAALRDGGRSASPGLGRSRLSGALVITEVAVAVALVVGAGLVVRSLAALLAVDSGIDVRRLVSARVTIDPLECLELGVTDAAPCRAFYQRLEERLGAMPGVRRYALSNQLPLEDRGGDIPVDIEDHPRPPSEPAHLLVRQVVTPEYFDLLGFTKEEGRLLTPADRRGAPGVAVASRYLADRYWPGQSAVGKRFRPVWWTDQWITIVGVVGDVRHRGAWGEPGLVYYTPLAQAPQAASYALVETSLALPVFESGFRGLVRSVDPRVPVSRVRAMPEVAAAAVAAPRVTAILLGGFALLAVILGAVGVYGVLSYGVSQRRREIGIRMAVGAEPGAVRRMVLRRAGVLVLSGLGIGLLAAWAGASAMRGFVYGVSVRDPITYAAAAAVFSVVGLAAAYLPARRATRVEALAVLRED